jgi:hypothetical protein
MGASEPKRRHEGVGGVRRLASGWSADLLFRGQGESLRRPTAKSLSGARGSGQQNRHPGASVQPREKGLGVGLMSSATPLYFEV